MLTHCLRLLGTHVRIVSFHLAVVAGDSLILHQELRRTLQPPCQLFLRELLFLAVSAFVPFLSAAVANYFGVSIAKVRETTVKLAVFPVLFRWEVRNRGKLHLVRHQKASNVGIGTVRPSVTKSK